MVLLRYRSLSGIDILRSWVMGGDCFVLRVVDNMSQGAIDKNNERTRIYYIACAIATSSFCPAYITSSSRTRQMGSYEILIKLSLSLSLAAMVRRCNTTALYCAVLQVCGCLPASARNVCDTIRLAASAAQTWRDGESDDTTWEGINTSARCPQNARDAS